MEYLKAIVAAVVTGIGAISAAVQAALSDGEITGQEWGLIISAVLTAVVATYGVYKARNRPPAEVPA